MLTLVRLKPFTDGNIGIFASAYSSLRLIARAQKWIGCQQKTTKKSATAAKLNDPSIATQPINGGTAPGKLPTTVFQVVWRLDQIEQ